MVKKYIFSLFCLSLLFIPISTIAFSSADLGKTTIDDSRCTTGNSETVNGVIVYTSGILKGIPCADTIKTLDEALIIVKNIVLDFLLPLVGVLFIIILIIGGILYISSGGNQKQLERAKKTLTAAIIGLIIITLSYTIILIFTKAIGGNTIKATNTTGSSTNTNVDGTGGAMTTGGGDGGGGTGGGAD